DEWGTAKAEELLIDVNQLNGQFQKAENGLKQVIKSLNSELLEAQENLDIHLDVYGLRESYYDSVKDHDVCDVYEAFLKSANRYPTDERDIRDCIEAWIVRKEWVDYAKRKLDELRHLSKKVESQRKKIESRRKKIESQQAELTQLRLRLQDERINKQEIKKINKEIFQLSEEIFQSLQQMSRTTAKIREIKGLLPSSYWQRDVDFTQ
ncbi:MAG: hypothetical protein MI861_24915, partial [Pirellulales bacterium]|nr:hypothetical protein [Pirellulales bacterium]